jgi:hypothetical protein
MPYRGLENTIRPRRYRESIGSMNHEAIDLKQKLSLFDETWTPKVIAELDDYQFKVVKLEGDWI